MVRYVVVCILIVRTGEEKLTRSPFILQVNSFSHMDRSRAAMAIVVRKDGVLLPSVHCIFSSLPVLCSPCC